MPSFITLGCVEVGEKFAVVGGVAGVCGWGRGHFDTNYQVTPTFVRLG